MIDEIIDFLVNTMIIFWLLAVIFGSSAIIWFSIKLLTGTL